MVRTLGFHFWGLGSTPGRGTKILQAAQPKKKKKSLDEEQTEIKIAGGSINNLRYADDTTIMAESKEELKSL